MQSLHSKHITSEAWSHVSIACTRCHHLTERIKVQAKFDCSYAESVVIVVLQDPCIVLQKRPQDAKGLEARKTLQHQTETSNVKSLLLYHVQVPFFHQNLTYLP
jgi:hypothetical protein